MCAAGRGGAGYYRVINNKGGTLREYLPVCDVNLIRVIRVTLLPETPRPERGEGR
jgi:hypothetical protein